MRINRLINDYYLDANIIDLLEKNNNSLLEGIYFKIDDATVLDFLKFNFYFHTGNEFLFKEILKYKYFINDSDLFDLRITDNQNTILLDLKNVSMKQLFLGPNREDVIKMGWMFCKSKSHELYIKKYPNYFFLDHFQIDNAYLSDLVMTILNSNKFRTEALQIRLDELNHDFLSNLKYIKNKFDQYSKNEPFKNQLALTIRSLTIQKDISVALNLIGLNHKDFWNSLK